MFLNADQLKKQRDKEEFQEIGSMAAFKYFRKYTQLEIQRFRYTLIQHMEYVKKSTDKRALHKREYDSRVNERQMQTTEGKVDTSKALDAGLVNTKSNGTESGKHDTSSSLGNDADDDDANIKPVYDEEPMAETTEGKVDTSKSLDAGLVNTKSNGIESGKHDTSSSSGNDADDDDANIKPVYDEEPMVEERLTRMLNNVMSYVLYLLN
nr:hypothetical protein [Tanacetum cinerariifolium]